MDEECQARALRGLVVVAALAGIYLIVQTYREYAERTREIDRSVNLELARRLDRLTYHVNREIGVAQDEPLHARVKHAGDLAFAAAHAGKPAGGSEPPIA